jgi:hypothetical protein
LLVIGKHDGGGTQEERCRENGSIQGKIGSLARFHFVLLHPAVLMLVRDAFKSCIPRVLKAVLELFHHHAVPIPNAGDHEIPTSPSILNPATRCAGHPQPRQCIPLTKEHQRFFSTRAAEDSQIHNVPVPWFTM